MQKMVNTKDISLSAAHYLLIYITDDDAKAAIH